MISFFFVSNCPDTNTCHSNKEFFISKHNILTFNLCVKFHSALYHFVSLYCTTEWLSRLSASLCSVKQQLLFKNQFNQLYLPIKLFFALYTQHFFKATLSLFVIVNYPPPLMWFNQGNQLKRILLCVYVPPPPFSLLSLYLSFSPKKVILELSNWPPSA